MKLMKVVPLIAAAIVAEGCNCSRVTVNVTDSGMGGGGTSSNTGGGAATGGGSGSTGGGSGNTGGGGGGSDLDAGPVGCGVQTCMTAMAECGPISDGCGDIIDCGGCPAPQSCGGAGLLSRCGGTNGCVAKTCSSAQANCGPLSDGCGRVLQCGTCTGTEVCGGSGVPNRCGTPSTTLVDGGCVPRTCAQADAGCGQVSDGCGGLTSVCGSCSNGQSCGGGGIPFKCGGTASATCTPKSCSDLNKNCGQVGDGCGTLTPNCGSCTLPEICGGGGIPNRCGAILITDGGAACNNLCQKQVTCDSGTSTITGTVYAPTNPALGYGNPDPLPNALVYIPNSTVQPFTPGVTCDRCGVAASGSPLVSTNSALNGSFTLSNVPCGTNIPLVIQLGRWRRQIVIPSVACCGNTALTMEQTHLPRNKSEGDIPLIAVTTGDEDPIECMLLKLGIDSSEFTHPSGNGRVHMYVDDGAGLPGSDTSATTLWDSATELAKHDVLIFDCVGNEQNKSTTRKDNVKDYLNKGGRLFASHYAYVWLYNHAPFNATANWSVGQSNPNNHTAYVDTSFPKGKLFSDWLQLVDAGSPGRLAVQTVRHDLNSVIAPSQQWIYADPVQYPNNPLQYTFNTPVNVPEDQQCGRVSFSDFHVARGSGSGDFPGECNMASPLTPQERALEYLLFDLSSCIQPDSTTVTAQCTPKSCVEQGFNCGLQSDGCGNVINCGSPDGGPGCTGVETCGGSGVPGVCGSGTMCTKLTCTDLGYQCGLAGDGCGGTLNCGTCPGSGICGGGGPNRCGAPGCTPQSCLQQNLFCGPAGDGCGNIIQCGICLEGESCGGGGQPGVCGRNTNCTPRTCSSIGANCGMIGDGCGGTLSCGSCTAPQTCGGLGVPNVCGSIG